MKFRGANNRTVCVFKKTSVILLSLIIVGSATFAFLCSSSIGSVKKLIDNETDMWQQGHCQKYRNKP